METKLVAQSTITCSYFLAVLMPLAGLFAGIYLMTKKESGHGVTVMGLSVLIGMVLLAVVNM